MNKELPNLDMAPTDLEFDALTLRVDQLEAALNNTLRGCRVCFNETEGSDQCQYTRKTCSDWSDNLGDNLYGGWTATYRDDTDDRDGACRYQWIVQCH